MAHLVHRPQKGRGTDREGIMTKIVVIERNVFFRAGIVQLLSGLTPEVTVSGHSYSDLDVEPDKTRHATLVLLSVSSPERRDSLIAASNRAYSPKSMILMSEGEPATDSMQGLPAVVAGLINKQSAPEVFLACVRVVLAGGLCFPQRIGDAPEIQHRPTNIPDTEISSKSESKPVRAGTEAAMLGLTPRQYEVLVLLARGNPIKAVARNLNISVATAKVHTDSVYQRLGVHNRGEAIYAASARGARLGRATSDPAPAAHFDGREG
jgi:two-component system nitrate/nitrite response regulator NarL